LVHGIRLEVPALRFIENGKWHDNSGSTPFWCAVGLGCPASGDKDRSKQSDVHVPRFKVHPHKIDIVSPGAGPAPSGTVHVYA